VGPTAVGKTALAIALAQRLSTEIISADSRQCYRELGIGVSKPGEEELAAIPHHFINSHSIHESVNAAVFEKFALGKLAAIFKQRDVAIMAGGTGLYIKAFCEGLDEVPPVSSGTREEITNGYQQHGLEWLQEQVRNTDPLYFKTGEVLNPQRLMRALEVIRSSGRSIAEYQSGSKTKRGFNIIRIGLELPREILNQRINSRVDGMVEAGLAEEARALLPWRHLNPLQTVGYSEFFDHFEGKTSFDEAVSAIKLNTRRYAKRQMTWFRKDPEIRWCSTDPDELMKMLERYR
jgi:tRNA dimethylallyltransferase